MKVRVKWALVSAALFGALGACGDRGLTDPPEPAVAGEPDPVASKPGPADYVVLVLKRSTPLAANLTTSGTIGPRGGSLEIPGAGVRVDFAPGAVAAKTTIRLTATKGGNVAYQFEPHGLTFAAPVIVRQQLRNTAAAKNKKLAAILQGSYYDADLGSLFVDAARRYAKIKESRPARLHATGSSLEFTIQHFSGYMVSTGLGPIRIDVAVEIP